MALTIMEERLFSRSVRALERIAEQMERLNRNLEAACAVSSRETEKTEDKE